MVTKKPFMELPKVCLVGLPYGFWLARTNMRHDNDHVINVALSQVMDVFT